MFVSAAVLAASLLCRAVDAYTPTISNPDAPDPQAECSGYKASHVRTSHSGLSATLTLAGDACNVYGTDVQALDLTVEYQDDHRLHVNIQPTFLGPENSTYYLLDENVVAKPGGSVSSHSSELKFEWDDDPSFYFQVIRRSTGDVIFDTKGSVLVFENQFLEVKNYLPQGYHISGLGEHIHGLALQSGFVGTNWAVDTPDTVDTNLYGTHPFYLEARYGDEGRDADHHGVYFRNAHGSEVIFGDDNLTWRFIGGSVDLYFFDGPSAADVTKQYASVIGLPAMHQYWTLGFHQCAWGYADWTEILESIANYSAADIPLETQWVDIDYMWGYRDFTVDQIRFRDDYTNMTLNQLHDNHQHFVPIIDVGIKYEPNDTDYGTYGRGLDLDLYLKNPGGTLFVGEAWPGAVVWPDWHHPAAGNFWADEIVRFHPELPFDGLWIDLNEPSNFCDNSCDSPFPAATEPQPGDRDINNPPYAIDAVRGPLNAGTASPNATHADGVVEYDVHNLYGHQALNATYHGLQALFPNDRPFVIGRSTFSGSGTVAGHWGGDNQATWESMASSIPQGLTFSLFGMPMFGSDTCGFGEDVTEELCGRWMQLSAFFSFYRNHYSTGVRKHEAWRWESVAEYSREIMKIRYSILPYMYTLLNDAHESGSTFLRALSWEFPQDASLFGIDTQFLVGSGLMVIPVLTEGATTVDGVFPGEGPWYDWYTQAPVADTSGTVTIDAPPGVLPLYVRGGTIIPQQAPGYTVYETRQGAWSLLVALDEDGNASGKIYLDDGKSINPQQTQTITLEVRHGKTLTVKIDGSYDFADYDVSPPALAQVTIMGAKNVKKNKKALFNAKHASAKHVDTTYDAASQTLVIKDGLSDLTSSGAWAREWTLKWH